MDSYTKEAFELVKAQASLRKMTEDEMVTMVASLSQKLAQLEKGELADQSVPPAEEEKTITAAEAKRSIKEKSITCLECGKAFKVISKKHLAQHGLSPADYKAKYGLKKDTALSCKELSRARKEKMSSMRLWEKRAADKDYIKKIGFDSNEDL